MVTYESNEKPMISIPVSQEKGSGASNPRVEDHHTHTRKTEHVLKESIAEESARTKEPAYSINHPGGRDTESRLDPTRDTTNNTINVLDDTPEYDKPVKSDPETHDDGTTDDPAAIITITTDDRDKDTVTLNPASQGKATKDSIPRDEIDHKHKANSFGTTPDARIKDDPNGKHMAPDFVSQEEWKGDSNPRAESDCTQTGIAKPIVAESIPEGDADSITPAYSIYHSNGEDTIEGDHVLKYDKSKDIKEPEPRLKSIRITTDDPVDVSDDIFAHETTKDPVAAITITTDDGKKESVTLDPERQKNSAETNDSKEITNDTSDHVKTEDEHGKSAASELEIRFSINDFKAGYDKDRDDVYKFNELTKVLFQVILLPKGKGLHSICESENDK